jgi:hypothetical protein
MASSAERLKSRKIAVSAHNAINAINAINALEVGCLVDNWQRMLDMTYRGKGRGGQKTAQKAVGWIALAERSIGLCSTLAALPPWSKFRLRTLRRDETAIWDGVARLVKKAHASCHRNHGNRRNHKICNFCYTRRLSGRRDCTKVTKVPVISVKNFCHEATGERRGLGATSWRNMKAGIPIPANSDTYLTGMTRIYFRGRHC